MLGLKRPRNTSSNILWLHPTAWPGRHPTLESTVLTETRLWIQTAWLPVSALPHPSCVFLARSLNLCFLLCKVRDIIPLLYRVVRIK